MSWNVRGSQNLAGQGPRAGQKGCEATGSEGVHLGERILCALAGWFLLTVASLHHLSRPLS